MIPSVSFFFLFRRLTVRSSQRQASLETYCLVMNDIGAGETQNNELYIYQLHTVMLPLSYETRVQLNCVWFANLNVQLSYNKRSMVNVNLRNKCWSNENSR